jgi:hypothetical protein
MRLFELLLNLALGITKIIQEKGDGAADVRLKDVDGFEELKKEADLHERAVRRFREKLEG